MGRMAPGFLLLRGSGLASTVHEDAATGDAWHAGPGPSRWLSLAAAGGIGIAVVIMLLVSAAGPGKALVAVALDRLLRSRPGRRVRAHLLWSLNPLLLWALVAGGHVDALAVAAGFLALALLVPPGWPERPASTGGWPGGTARPRPLAALAAGGLLGAAADIKITYALFALAAAWALRKTPRSLALMACAAAAVLVPSYLWFGPPALKVLIQRDATATSDNMYRLWYHVFGDGHLPGLTILAVLLLAGLAILLLRRLPDGFPGLPAVQPALAFAVAWLLVWPYQRPWYDAMAFCLLALYPAIRLDWPMLIRLAAAVIYYLPGVPTGASVPWLNPAPTGRPHTSPATCKKSPGGEGRMEE